LEWRGKRRDSQALRWVGPLASPLYRLEVQRLLKYLYRGAVSGRFLSPYISF
jgi:hypothetical protein